MTVGLACKSKTKKSHPFNLGKNNPKSIRVDFFLVLLTSLGDHTLEVDDPSLKCIHSHTIGVVVSFDKVRVIDKTLARYFFTQFLSY